VLKTWSDFLQRQPLVLHLSIGAVLLALIWRIDLIVATQVSLAVFYLIPIGYVSWFCGEPWSYATAFLSAAAWLQADLALGHQYSHWFIPYVDASTRLGWFLIFTAMSRIVQQLRRLNDVEREASKLKSDMVALVSHEFGNSLTTLRLALTLLRESTGENAEAERAEHYAVLERVIAHLSATSANFLNLNRLVGGHFQPHLKLTRLRRVTREALAMLEPAIERRNVTLVLDLPSVGVPVRADPDAMSIVMTNLIGNAFKYTPDGGTITIRIAVDNAAPAAALVSVADTGIGIAPEDLKKILSGHYRTREAKRIAKGYGVGLRVVSELLDSQDSALGVESEPGKGSRFYFRLPLWEGPGHAAANIS
jgi:two-component system phosphate regulon sensor histidine kinase PhoR